MNKYLYYIKQLGLRNILLGFIKKTKLNKLHAKYHFDKWHLYPHEHREYALWIIDHINKVIIPNNKYINSAVEIGCGLGEIISNLNIPTKVGYDIYDNVITAAQDLNSQKKTSFIVGSFDSITNQTIDILIVVNFTAMISPLVLTEHYSKLLSSNTIERIIVECVDDKEYPYLHNYKDMFPDNYKLEIKSKIFPPVKRWLEIYKRT